MVYLSDNGGHGNLWIQNPASGETRQITFEKDPRVVAGVPIWSPDGKSIAFAINEPAEGSASIDPLSGHPTRWKRPSCRPLHGNLGRVVG